MNQKRVPPVLLNLHALTRDARRCIWKLLNHLDKELIRCAHNSQRPLTMDASFLLLCATYNYIELFLWAFKQMPSNVDLYQDRAARQWFSWFCFHGNLPMVKWYFKMPKLKLPFVDELSWVRALENNHFHILEYWIESDPDAQFAIVWNIVTFAALNNNRAGLRWCIEQGYEISLFKDLPVYAIRGGHVELARELVEELKFNVKNNYIAAESIKFGCWDRVFPWLQGVDWLDASIATFKPGSLEALKWIHRNAHIREESWRTLAEYYVAEPWSWRIPEFEEFFRKHGYIQ